MFDVDWQIAIGNSCDQILHHIPSRALLIQKLKKEKLSIVFPHQILQHALSVINADSSGTVRCKTIDKVERSPLQITKRSQPRIYCGSRKCLYFFHVWIPDRLIRQKRKRELLCRHRRGKQPRTKSCGRGQPDWRNPVHRTRSPVTAPVSGRGEGRRSHWQKRQKKHQDPGGTNSCCSANSNRKMTLCTLFWLVYPLLMFFFSPMIPENLTYLM